MKHVTLPIVFLFFVLSPFSAYPQKVPTPKEYGVYIKTPKGLSRLMPNLVFDQEGVYYIESLSPGKVLLKDVEYFVVYGDYKIEVLTLNPMVFFAKTVVGKTRYMFGKDIPIEVKRIKDKLYLVKPREVLGRGYFSIWIDDTAWDFIIE